MKPPIAGHTPSLACALTHFMYIFLCSSTASTEHSFSLLPSASSVLPNTEMPNPHRGKLLKREDVCQVLRDVPSQQTVVQVIGSTEKLAAEPLGRRVMSAWNRISGPIFGLLSNISSSSWWTRWWDMMMILFHGTWQFFRTFMPGYVPEPSTRRVHRRRGDAGEDEEPVEVRVQRRVENTGQRCRDEINTEMATRFRRQDGPG